jgi:hypothetical protein
MGIFRIIQNKYDAMPKKPNKCPNQNGRYLLFIADYKAMKSNKYLEK